MIHQDVAQPAYYEEQEQAASIKLIGVGGGGCNAVEHMIGADIHGVDFTLVNTDAQALSRYNPDNIIQLGTTLTRGLGAGTDPEIGRLAAEEDADLIAAAIGDTDMLFLTAGMGGGTGTGAIPVIARIARELGVLTVAVVTKPFAFEGGKRRQVAEQGLAELRRHVDSLIVVPNENLLTHLGPNISLIEAFAASNDVLTNAVQSIAELITNPGLINVDFADVKSVMTENGEAMMSTGRGIGEYRARDAAIAATESPLLEEIDLNEARGILANITASDTLSMGEFQIVGDILDQITAEDANVVIGTVFDPDMNDEIRVTVVATGLQAFQRRPAPQQRSRKPASAGFLGFGSNRNNGGSKRKSGAKRSRLRYRDAPEERTAPPLPRPHPIEDVDTRAHNEPVNDQAYDRAAYDEPARDAVRAYDTADAQNHQPEPVAQFCQACGNRPDNHTENCPLQQGSKQHTRPRIMVMDRRDDVDEAMTQRNDRVASTQVQSAAKATTPRSKSRPSRDQFGTGQKKPINKYIAGLVAGATVLVTVFYLLISNSGTTDDQAMAEAEAAQNEASTDVAGRKLRDAQKRLSGL
jgi:cell division protein FtsZ